MILPRPMPVPDDSTIVILGGSGQVGRSLTELLPQAVSWDRAQADLTQVDALIARLQEAKPRIVINAAAYTRVDDAEREGLLAMQINATAPDAIARWCHAQGVLFVHYSTDYVFDGSGTSPWKETDPPHPKNIYGKSKRQGEVNVAEATDRFLILRTSWVFAPWGLNFVRKMLALFQDREEIRVVDDQVGSPTYAPDLARATCDAIGKVLQNSSLCGIYHACNHGAVSWRGFAQEIWKQARARGYGLKTERVLGIPSSAYPTRAERPLNSRLDTSLFEKTFDYAFPTWQDALMRFFEKVL